MTLTGRVSREPDIGMDKAQYIVEVHSLVIPTTQEKSMSQSQNGQGFLALLGTTNETSGRVLVTTRIYPEYKYGDILQITCSLKTPQNYGGGTFDYPKYLAKEGVYSLCSFPKSVTSIVGGRDVARYVSTNDAAGAQNFEPLQWAMSAIFALKSKVQNQINSLWPEPEGSLMAGFLYGSKSGLPPELVDDFTKTGLTHIIAVSGFNVTIIATALMALLIGVGLWRQEAYWAVMSVLIIFVIFTGATASVLRAAIMGALVLTARQIGRMSQIGGALVLTAAVMTALNPYVILWDAGFQLSFLATLGLVYISPVLDSVIARSPEGDVAIPSKLRRGLLQRLSALRNDAFEMIREPLVQTLSAIIATLPLILYQFGRLSIVAPLVNVLVLWIIPWLMLGGFIALVLSFIFFPLGQIVAWISLIGLKYVIFIIQFFGRQSWSAVDWQIPLWGMVIMYVILIYVIARARRPNCHSERGSPRRDDEESGFASQQMN